MCASEDRKKKRLRDHSTSFGRARTSFEAFLKTVLEMHQFLKGRTHNTRKRINIVEFIAIVVKIKTVRCVAKVRPNHSYFFLCFVKASKDGTGIFPLPLSRFPDWRRLWTSAIEIGRTIKGGSGSSPSHAGRLGISGILEEECCD